MSDPRLVSALYLAYEKRPILVVGGGPSAPAQYAEVMSALHNPIVVSANDHAFKLGLTPDFIFCKDHVHTETKEKMRDRLRPYGLPIVSAQWWADYRCAHWPIQGHSGFQAIALAVLLGGAPVVPIGMDCFQKGTYFHALDRPNVSLGRREGYWDRKIDVLAAWLEGSVVRPVGGPFLRASKRWSADEALPEPRMPQKLAQYANMPTYLVRAKSRFFMAHDAKAELEPGVVFPVSAAERAQYLRVGVAEDC